jgi:hypothetical protein
MKRLFLNITLAMVVSLSSFAQDMADALRYSFLQVQGTARSGGMGNAFGALGGDFTSLSINPAGLGLYRSSEFAITPLFNQDKTKATMLGSSLSDSKYNFGMNNLSYVASWDLGNKSASGLVNINFGVGFNRLRDFNSNSIAEGANAKSSFMDYIVDRANRFGTNNSYYEKLAWDTDILIYDDKAKEYFSDIGDAGYGQTQRKTINRMGSVDEFSLALGLNFNHRLYLGASVGILDLYYNDDSEIYEKDVKGNIPYVNDFSFMSKLKTSGNGYNVKLGAIFKPTNNLRLGASVHSPTFYNLNDLFETQMKTYMTYKDGSENYNKISPLSEYEYDMESPLKATLSAAYIIGSKGLISADYEFVDYSATKLRRGGDGYNFADENKDISEAYKSVGNLRVGGEYKVTGTFGLRAGYELYPSPYNADAFGAKQPNADNNLSVLSFGLGYRSGKFFFDAAYRLSKFDQTEYINPTPSAAYPAPTIATYNSEKGDILFTLGFRF